MRLLFHLRTFMANIYKTSEVIDQGLTNTPVNEWPPIWKQRFQAMDKDSMLAADAKHFGLMVKASTIPGAGLGVFALTRLSRGTIVGWYHGTVIHRNMAENDKVTGRTYYGEAAFGCTKRRQVSHAITPRTDHEDVDDKLRNKYVATCPPEFCVTAYINDAINTAPSSTSPTTNTAPTTARPVNVEYKCRPTLTMHSLTDPYVVQWTVKQSINPGQELFTSYGDRYWRHKQQS